MKETKRMAILKLNVKLLDLRKLRNPFRLIDKPQLKHKKEL
jgi:hypothetical protein